MRELVRTVFSGTKAFQQEQHCNFEQLPLVQLLLVLSHSIEWQCLVVYWSIASLFLFSIFQEIALLNKSPALPLKVKRFQLIEMSGLPKVPFMLLPSFSVHIIFQSSLGCSSYRTQSTCFLAVAEWLSVFLYCPWWNKSTPDQPCFFKKEVECSSCICLENKSL